MTINPEIQRVAQGEIDSVIGNNRLPTFDDRASLPYIEAIYRELLRFAPPVPLCIPHSTNEDDHYKGYFIPKGHSKASFVVRPINIYVRVPCRNQRLSQHLVTIPGCIVSLTSSLIGEMNTGQ
jgi:hypothetical protein